MSARLLCFATMIVLALGRVQAQTASEARFAADRAQVLIGEPFDLVLLVEIPEGATVNMPTFPAQWSAFMVREVGAATEAENGGVRTIQQVLRVILWQIGAFQTPDTVITYQLPGAAVAQELWAEPVVITVNSVLQPDDLTLRPLRPPVALPTLSWWQVGAALAGAGVAAVAGIRYLRGRQIRPAWQLDDKNHPAARVALRRLESLTAEGVAMGSVYAGAADSIRQYITDRFGIAATDLTTHELLERLETVNARRQHELRQLLERADLVKFARATAKSEASQQYLTAARRWVLTVEADVQARDT